MALKRTLKPLLVIAVLGLMGGALAGRRVLDLIRRRAQPGGHERTTSALRLVPIAPVTSRLLVGDARLGRELFSVHCVSCHGFSGHGDGPATSFLHPVPRDHTSPYMATRSDETLYRVIDEGGGPNDVSSLMPSFSDRFDDTEIWSLVAYLRTLRPDLVQLLPAGARLEQEPTVTSLERAARVARETGVKLAPSELRVDVLRAYATAPNAPEKTLAFLAVERVVAAPSDLWAVVSRDASGGPFVRRVLPSADVVSTNGQTVREVFERALAPEPSALGATPLPADVAALASAVRATAERLELRLRAALEQRAGDIEEAAAVLAKYTAKPGDLPPVQQLFIRNCAACHGATGKTIGPNTTLHPTAWPRNLAEGVYLNAYPDEHLAFMIRYGGSPARHSGAMPGFGAAALSESQIQDLVRYVRTLAIPPYDGGKATHAH